MGRVGEGKVGVGRVGEGRVGVGRVGEGRVEVEWGERWRCQPSTFSNPSHRQEQCSSSAAAQRHQLTEQCPPRTQERSCLGNELERERRKEKRGEKKRSKDIFCITVYNTCTCVLYTSDYYYSKPY